ncbi:MAG: hypothetical protein Q9218_002598, partial [Villophora microphyllina]
MVLGIGQKSRDRHCHPSTEHICQLWQVFIENVDPLTKIVHVPSLQPAIQKATADPERIPRNFEALMFAMYAAAVMSLHNEECNRRLGKPRGILLSYYLSATKLALSRTRFMGTMSLVVLQALVLHLFTVRNIYGPRAVFTLTGVAIRIGEGMGLHRDGESSGVPPFEAEIRRRIWWQLQMHDFRAAELAGLAKFRDFKSLDNTCNPPLNINDSELYPGMSSPASPSSKLTDMLFFQLRIEFTSFARRRVAQFREKEQNKNEWVELLAARSDQSTKDGFVNEIEEILEMKYLRYCDPSQPLQLLTMLTARSALNMVRFLAHHPRTWTGPEMTPEPVRKYVWDRSITILEQFETTQSDRRLQGYSWYYTYHMPWHVLIHVLDTLRAQPLILNAAKTWRIIEATFENNPDMVANTKKPIHVAVGNLCLTAWDAHDAALTHQGVGSEREPQFITKLRQQREAAKARRKQRLVRNKDIETYQP